jgi:2-C-methyl-D-erythritol 4-phosphate cytidylyltransferase / 2-C-methyl-D-erythritol 2,4-cyclodiphosphate synthase
MLASSPPVAMILMAAGRGLRLKGDLPKQYRQIAGQMVLTRALTAACKGGHLTRIITVIHNEDQARYDTAIASLQQGSTRLSPCFGGTTRQDSVLKGLEALAELGFPADGIVLIHDAARPFLSETVLMRAILAAQRHGAAIPVLPLADTLALLDENALVSNPSRAGLVCVQTPQAFHFAPILAAHRRARAESRQDFTDDASLLRAFDHQVQAFEGDPDLFKITLESDLLRAERHLAALNPAETRVGIGYDVHAFTTGDHVMLGGVRIAHERALLGHSDADPVLHALTDALLGTIGDGDIGQHFPPHEAQWRGAASRVFLRHAAMLVRAQGGRILQVDTSIVCEAPKIGPHRRAMQQAIGEMLDLAVDRVGVKATTSEGLGFTGRKEGIAAMAVVSVAFEGSD